MKLYEYKVVFGTDYQIPEEVQVIGSYRSGSGRNILLVNKEIPDLEEEGIDVEKEVIEVEVPEVEEEVEEKEEIEEEEEETEEIEEEEVEEETEEVEEEETEETFDCPECDKSFDSERGLKIHKTQVHEEEE